VFSRSLSVCLVVPTFNPGGYWDQWLCTINTQLIQTRGIIVDSTSTDGTDFLVLPAQWQLLRIDSTSFNHGGSRNLALQQAPAGTDVVVFLTQDALLVEENALELLINAFDDPSVACAFGRQLPHTDATPLAAHARLFNYPTTSRTLSMADQPQLGIKTCFISNSFAAYRLVDLLDVGGFPSDVILGEDMSVAASMLMAGKRVAYVAEACVYHSHNYTIAQEFRRYFDTGVFHARSSWLLQTFGEAGGEGLRFLLSEMKYLWRHAPSWLFAATLHTFAKWFGYKLGRQETYLPLCLKRLFSMHKGYWN
jgi:rhamnosyltransferase